MTKRQLSLLHKRKMKFISNYEEFGAKNGISVTDHISQKSIPEKEMILSYLSSGKYDGVACGSIFDYITKESKLDTIKLYTDGIYDWTDEEMYHFAKYNMELDPEFIEYVKSKRDS